MLKKKHPRWLSLFPLIGILFCFILGLPSPARAANQTSTKIIVFEGKYENDRNPAVDYALAIPGLTGKQIDRSGTFGRFFDKVIVRDEGPRGANGVTLFFENTGGGVLMPGQTDAFIIKVINAPREIRMPTGTSTFRRTQGAGRIPAGDNVPLVGFRVRNDPEYTLLNDPFEPFEFSVMDLEYLVNVNEFADPFQFLDFGNSFGFTPWPDSDILLADTDFESEVLNIPGIVDEGNWLYTRGKLFIDDEEVSRFVHGDQVLPPAPEPSSLLLMSLGALGLVVRRFPTRVGNWPFLGGLFRRRSPCKK